MYHSISQTPDIQWTEGTYNIDVPFHQSTTQYTVQYITSLVTLIYIDSYFLFSLDLIMLVNKDRPERGALKDLKNSRQKYEGGCWIWKNPWTDAIIQRIAGQWEMSLLGYIMSDKKDM